MKSLKPFCLNLVISVKALFWLHFGLLHWNGPHVVLNRPWVSTLFSCYEAFFLLLVPHVSAIVVLYKAIQSKKTTLLLIKDVNEHSILPDNDTCEGHDQYIKPNLITMLRSALDCSARRSFGYRELLKSLEAIFFKNFPSSRGKTLSNHIEDTSSSKPIRSWYAW